jgi:hypothetical protein
VFTRKRLAKFVENFREKSGQLPTLRDLEEGGFGGEVVKAAIKGRVIEEFYVTLTSGTIVKGYKLAQPK